MTFTQMQEERELQLLEKARTAPKNQATAIHALRLMLDDRLGQLIDALTELNKPDVVNITNKATDNRQIAREVAKVLRREQRRGTTFNRIGD